MSSHYLKLDKISIQRQLHSIESDLSSFLYDINDIGEVMPASVMIHNFKREEPRGISYMNEWGRMNLGTTLEELNNLGEEYLTKYFLAEETETIVLQVAKYCAERDFTKHCSFFQRVKVYGEKDYLWFYSSCKLLRNRNKQIDDNIQLIMVSCPVQGMGNMVNKVNKTLGESLYIKDNYKKFVLLSKREKEIIGLMAYGKTSKEIAEVLFLSTHTVQTHRKNILKKTEFTSFAELLKFAMAFELI
ncbi:response regulator transcription factor [Myroides indicus]|uniref:Regulatory LuxR family protein n=1 Tax=Myroides indicus TaxID=1323422 RepID=A0A4R7FCB4_9FLAO|nr:helix-turn-helix transcriptional regulator [Myroides indicus]TDS65079.1 regulatory LuxR family protein [Myroides indicus]